jgi:hypothetical protein
MVYRNYKNAQFSVTRRGGSEADHSPPSSADAGIHTYSPKPSSWRAWLLIKPRNSFIFKRRGSHTLFWPKVRKSVTQWKDFCPDLK